MALPSIKPFPEPTTVSGAVARWYNDIRSRINSILSDYYTAAEVDTLLEDYAYLPGRSAGQTLYGFDASQTGNAITFLNNHHATAFTRFRMSDTTLMWHSQSSPLNFCSTNMGYGGLYTNLFTGSAYRGWHYVGPSFAELAYRFNQSGYEQLLRVGSTSVLLSSQSAGPTTGTAELTSTDFTLDVPLYMGDNDINEVKEINFNTSLNIREFMATTYASVCVGTDVAPYASATGTDNLFFGTSLVDFAWEGETVYVANNVMIGREIVSDQGGSTIPPAHESYSNFFIGRAIGLTATYLTNNIAIGDYPFSYCLGAKSTISIGSTNSEASLYESYNLYLAGEYAAANHKAASDTIAIGSYAGSNAAHPGHIVKGAWHKAYPSSIFTSPATFSEDGGDPTVTVVTFFSNAGLGDDYLDDMLAHSGKVAVIYSEPGTGYVDIASASHTITKVSSTIYKIDFAWASWVSNGMPSKDTIGFVVMDSNNIYIGADTPGNVSYTATNGIFIGSGAEPFDGTSDYQLSIGSIIQGMWDQSSVRYLKFKDRVEIDGLLAAGEECLYITTDGSSDAIAIDTGEGAVAKIDLVGSFLAFQGTVVAPGHSFYNYPGSGMYAETTTLRFSVNGALALTLYDDGESQYNESAHIFAFPDGSVSAPSITFSNDFSTGLYRSTNLLNLASGGVKQLGLYNDGATEYVQVVPQLRGEDGSSTLPGYSFTSNPASGIAYDSTNDYIEFYISSVLYLRLNDTTGICEFPHPIDIDWTDASIPALKVLQRGTGNVIEILDVASDTSPTVVDASGRFIHGYTGSLALAGVSNCQVQVLGTNIGQSSIGCGRWSADANAPRLALAKSRNASVGSFTAVQSGDQLGVLTMGGDDGTDMSTQSFQLLGLCDGTVSTGIVPGKLQLKLATSAGTLTTRWECDSAGLSKFGSPAGSDYTTIDSSGVIGFAGLGRIGWTAKTASSRTLYSGTETGTYTNVAALDANTWVINEVSVSGIDVVLNFTSVTAFNWVFIVGNYIGSSQHAVQIQMWDYTNSVWRVFHLMEHQSTTANYQALANYSFFVPNCTDFISGGAVQVRFYHPLGTTTTHAVTLNVCALY